MKGKYMEEKKKRSLPERLLGVLLLSAFLIGPLSACSPMVKQQTEQMEQQNYQAEAYGEEAEVAQISDGNYAYEGLSQEEKQVYNEILSVILDHQEKIMLSCTDTEIMRKAYTAVCADYGGLFWISGYVFTKYTKGEETVSLEFAPNYTMTEEERQQIQQQIDGVVEAWLGGISITDTDYDKVKYIYDLLSTRAEYVEGAENSQNIISVFLNGQTVCQGYACAAQYLMSQLGIPSVIVSGTALGDPHAWNLFRMDGEYYYMDVTWGRGCYVENGMEKYFIDYKYMAMTTEELLQSHVPDEELVLPECTAVENNYYRKEGKYIQEWAPDTIGAYFSQAYEEKGIVTLRFADRELYDQTVGYFIEAANIVDYCPQVEEISYITEENWLEISFCFLE